MNNNPYELGSVLIDMGILTAERLDELIDQFKKKGAGSFNRFLIEEKQINYDQLRLAILKQKVA